MYGHYFNSASFMNFNYTHNNKMPESIEKCIKYPWYILITVIKGFYILHLK